MTLENKVCIVTGGNSGIGKETVRAFAHQGAYVIMICRNEQRATEAKKELINDTDHSGIKVMLADLASQHDIRSVADQIRNKFEKIDVLVNNAGIIPRKRHETLEGIERTLAINHLGPFLLTNLLLDKLKAAEAARVVNVSSEVHRLGAKFFDINNLQLSDNFSSMKAYGISKLCNIMFTYELSKRTADGSITINCLHPGVVQTQLSEEAGLATKFFYLMGKPFMKSPKQGAQPTIYLATSDDVKSISGKYFKNKKLTKPASIAYDDEITKQLWQKSAQLTDLP